MEKNIKVFLLTEKGDKFFYRNSIDEKEYERVLNLLKGRKIANFRNTDNEFYIDTCDILYFDLIEEWVF